MQIEHESGRKMDWITLGDNFSCGYVIISRDNLGYMLLIYTYIIITGEEGVEIH